MEALCRETKISLHFIRVRYPSFVNEFVKSDEALEISYSCRVRAKDHRLSRMEDRLTSILDFLSSILLVLPLRLRVFARALFWLSAARGCASTRSSEQPQ